MKTLNRALVAVLAIAGSVHAAPLPAAESRASGAAPTSAAPSTDAAHTAAVATALAQRVQTLERELARLRAQEEERERLTVEPDPTFFDG